MPITIVMLQKLKFSFHEWLCYIAGWIRSGSHLKIWFLVQINGKMTHCSSFSRGIVCAQKIQQTTPPDACNLLLTLPPMLDNPFQCLLTCQTPQTPFDPVCRLCYGVVFVVLNSFSDIETWMMQSFFYAQYQ